MHGVGPSTVLGGRYAVQRRLAQQPRAERWSAHDLTLERDVVVVVFAADDPNADAALDAARRAAGVDHDRLVRILDVGRSEGVAYFVEEALREAHTLAHLLEQGGLPAEEARRIAGETATGLEAARGRGLHHLRLTPSSILRAGDGAIKVSRPGHRRGPRRRVDDLDSAQALARGRRGRRRHHVCRPDEPLAPARPRTRSGAGPARGRRCARPVRDRRRRAR